MSKELTLGSLFDGSGGFPLAATILGIEPVWASEIDPFPIKVTKARFPNMKHLGSVTEITGYEVEPVDIITFSSPCQNLSIAGDRKGLEGEQSSLFYEAVRIIREMREKTNGQYPKYAVWENVRGAFSSNGGADFHNVLQELTGYSIPRPQKWSNAGCIVADTSTVSWRLLDAQFWGVPQCRKRIFLVCDFTGGGNRQLLFSPEKLYWTPEQNGSEGKIFARTDDKSSKETGNEIEDIYCLIPGSYGYPSINVTLPLTAHDAKQTQFIVYGDQVRRFTPLECCRLQGFPDNWCEDLETDDFEFWKKTWHYWNSYNDKKLKSDNQILKWMHSKANDTNQYKMWGNGVALPCAIYVLEQILEAENK